MKLYLVQHAEAKQEEEDPARPLSEKGWENLDKISDFLKGKDIKVSKIFHSGKLRAKQTAEKLSEAIDSSRARCNATASTTLSFGSTVKTLPFIKIISAYPSTEGFLRVVSLIPARATTKAEPNPRIYFMYLRLEITCCFFAFAKNISC
ncbi:MAG: histidine phosphatase family protein [Candidatus Bathyarchaeota archaeon]|nr:histidine phosphatase family protein [Candidatus Bathyarchaeota archaeon]